MADMTQPTKDSLTQKFNLNEEVPNRESLSGADDAASTQAPRAARPAARPAAQKQASSQDDSQASDQTSMKASGSGDALEVLRGSVVGVLDSVVREYEPQIANFTSNIAHQAVDRGVDIAQTAVTRVKAQSWLRLGLAAALGIGIIAVLGYEAEQAATEAAPRQRKPLH